MSILLDALKRSESQRELGSVPTLQTSTDLLNRDGAEPPSWPAASMVLLVAVLITWLGLQQFQVPDSAPAPSLAQQETGSSETAVPDSAGQTVDEQPAASEKTILPKFTGAKVLNSDRVNAEKARLEEQLRAGRDLRDYVAPEQGPAGSGDEPSRDNASRQAELPKVEIAGRDLTTVATGTSAEEEYEPEMISYWQVPEAMREGLPDLRISVLVFAEQPQNRFVLLNGERLREGEELPNGLSLVEIRRDRAIFSYRNYRFYLKS